MSKPLLAFLISLGLAVILTPLAMIFGRKVGITDKVGDTTPSGQTKITKKPTARTGGLALIFAILLPFLFLNLPSSKAIGITGGAVIIFIVMFLDDIYGLGPIPKLLGQLAAATAAILGGLRIGYLTNIFGQGWLILEWLSIPLTYFWILTVTNAMNFIDGLDGLAAGITVIATIASAFSSSSRGIFPPTILLASIAGGALGFLPFNFKPAKIFMGDSGANLIGFLIATATIWGTSKATSAVVIGVAILCLGVPMFDVFFSAIRRILSGKSPLKGDMDNIHYILVKKGWSETSVVLVFYLITAILSAIALSFTVLR